jgi:mannose-1-phosphate guanylyltransferase
MELKLIPIILAGGKGERFWPVSRRQRPKQFLCLDGSGKSLLQSTAERLLDLAGGWDNLWVITSEIIAEGVEKQLPNLPKSNILVEPQGRDTAPAIAWATLEITKKYGEDAILGFFPADHWIGDVATYHKTLLAAAQQALAKPSIVTLGITPNQPATGYGYIEQGEKQGDFNQLPVYQVIRFTEKPDEATAQSFIETGNFSWNSGMFIFQAKVILDELAKYAPELLNALSTKGRDAYAGLAKESIDYALMEKTQLAYVLPADFGWDDLGDWKGVERLLKGEQDNVELGTHISKNTQDAVIYASDDDEIIVTIGLKDLVIVRDGKVTLVADKNQTQDIKEIVKSLYDNPELRHLL